MGAPCELHRKRGKRAGETPVLFPDGPARDVKEREETGGGREEKVGD